MKFIPLQQKILSMEAGDLMQFDLFSEMDPDNMQRFIDRFEVFSKKFPAGSTVFLQGMSCDKLSLLVRGSARATMINPDGKQVIIEFLLAPHVLAPAALFATQNRYPVNVEAFTDCTVAYIGREHFVNLMGQEPSVLDRFVRLLSDKSIFLAKKVNSFALQNLKGRLASYLLMHEHVETQQQIADFLGVARPSLARVLAEMIEAGWVRMDGRKIVVVDAVALKRFL